MAERLGEALLDLDTNDKNFNKGIDQAEKRANVFGRTLDNVRSKALAVGKALAIGTFAAYGVGITTAIKRLEEMRKAHGQVDQALKNSGNTARTSAKEIEAWADALEDRTGRAAEEIMAVSANLASFGFGREQFFRALSLADDMSAAWGGDLRQNLEGLSRALDDPIAGMAMLSKRGIQLTDEQKQLAQAFLVAGDKASAQGVVFEALEAQVKGVAEAGFNGLTKALAQARKAWETAFEDLVQGNGQAGDLRDTLVDLAETLSSPEFIGAVMGFGRLIVATINGIAQVVVGAHNALRDFMNWLDAPNQIRAEMPAGGTLKNVFPEDYGAAEGDIMRQLEWRWQRGGKQPDASDLYSGFQVGPDGNFVVEPPPGSMFGQPLTDPYEGFKYSGGSGGSAKRDPVRDLIASLQGELEVLRELDPVQRRMIELRQEMAKATPEQAKEIEKLVANIEAESRAMETAAAVGQMFGDTLLDAFEGILDGSKSLNDVLGDLGKMLQRVVLQGALLGQGPLGGLFGPQNANGMGGLLSGLFSGFSGFFASGGLIPNGSFGIVGEAGPEPVIGTARGAMVLPNKSLAGMGGQAPVQVNVNNYAGVSVGVEEESDGQGGRRLNIVLGEGVAAELSRPNSPANLAARRAGALTRRT